jgi:hypothetical protein
MEAATDLLVIPGIGLPAIGHRAIGLPDIVRPPIQATRDMVGHLRIALQR